MSENHIGGVSEVRCPGTCKISECIDAQFEFQHCPNIDDEIFADIEREDQIDQHFCPIGFIGAVTRKMTTDEKKYKGAILHEERIMAIWRKLSKIFNEPQTGIPIYMAYEPVISEKIITQEYYEKLMNGEFSITQT